MSAEVCGEDSQVSTGALAGVVLILEHPEVTSRPLSHLRFHLRSLGRPCSAGTQAAFRSQRAFRTGFRELFWTELDLSARA